MNEMYKKVHEIAKEFRFTDIGCAGISCTECEFNVIITNSDEKPMSVCDALIKIYERTKKESPFKG